MHWAPEVPIHRRILKTLILRIYWDGSTRPAVETPAGDFFGIGLCEVVSFASKYIGMSSGGFFCKFSMPFRKGFRVEIENTDEEIDSDTFMNILYQLDDALPENCGYFHAQFLTGRKEGTDPLDIAELTDYGCSFSMQGRDLSYLNFLEAPE